MRTPIVVPLEILKPYVTGKVYEYFSSFEKAPEAKFTNTYVTHTLDFVVPYLNGKEVLNARATDQQCQIAQSAYFDFKQMFETNVKVANKKNSLEEAQAALRKLTYRDSTITQALETIAKALMYPEHVEDNVLSMQLRSFSSKFGRDGNVVLSELFNNAARAFV